MKVLVLGLGNELRGDDAAGLHVARMAHERLRAEPHIAVQATSEMGLALLDEITGTEALVLVDAIETGRVPAGHVHELGLADLGGNRSRSPHFIGLGDTLATGKLLGLPMPREVRVFAIEVADTTILGAGLSPAVAAALPAAADHVVATARALARAEASGV